MPMGEMEVKRSTWSRTGYSSLPSDQNKWKAWNGQEPQMTKSPKVEMCMKIANSTENSQILKSTVSKDVANLKNTTINSKICY